MKLRLPSLKVDRKAELNLALLEALTHQMPPATLTIPLELTALRNTAD